MNEIYIINANGQIESVNYDHLVWPYVVQTTTPRGVGPMIHVREELWYRVGDNLFENESDAFLSASADKEVTTGTRPTIDEVFRFEGWTWGYAGNFPMRLEVFDTQAEASTWLFECAKIFFRHHPDAPQTFNSRTEAEMWLTENLSE